MFPELNITTKKVLAGDLGVKPKNITRNNPHGDADYSQAAANWRVHLLADKAIPVALLAPALLKPALNPLLRFLKHLSPGFEPTKPRLYHKPTLHTVVKQKTEIH